MRILVATGRLAESLVRDSAKYTDVLGLDIDIAAFLTPQMLIRAAPFGYDLILVPGVSTADFTEAEKILRTQIRLGPKHAADLGFVLEHIEEIDLSRTVPACVLLENRIHEGALEEVERLEKVSKPILQIKSLRIGGTARMKVLSEIVDATSMSKVALIKKVHYYEEQGADMIDLGISLDATAQQVQSVLKTTLNASKLPVSIDTVRPDLIIAGLNAGADLILSLNGENLPLVGGKIVKSDVPAVVIPGPGKISLKENMQEALDMGIKVIADPVLDPPLQGLVASLDRYLQFKESYPDVPLFFGAGNVTELLDADSIGANALLSGLAGEIGADILFTPEFSPKTKGSVKELRVGSEMMILAKARKTPPKDLGLDLLLLKEKRFKPREADPLHFSFARSDHLYELDPIGGFRIVLSNNMIVVRHNRFTFTGTNAEDLINTLIDNGLVSRLDHVGYLGRELQKAELALQLGRSYIQDESLFPIQKI